MLIEKLTISLQTFKHSYTSIPFPISLNTVDEIKIYV